MRLVKFTIVLLILAVPGFLRSMAQQASPATGSRNYYVNSRDGNDALNGLTPQHAWRSLNKVNSTVFHPGDSVLFIRNGRWSGQLTPAGSGMPGSPIVFGAYGQGQLPQLEAKGRYKSAVLIRNISNVVVRDMDISNKDSSVAEQKTGPTGVCIMAEDCGTISNITLSDLYVHDINGDNRKFSKEGCGIYWECQGPKPSNIDHLNIENCLLERVDRNGIRGNGTFSKRSTWFPGKNLVIRGCTLNDIGGDGIVIKAFDTALVERNKVLYTRMRARDNAVAIWPHSSDHTVIQYNEVAYTKNTNRANDGQSFDIDGNCRNTIIQYNYSHDNDGGFMLVISDAINADNVMTGNSIIRYNLSVNDGLKRKRLFNFAGVTDSTAVQGNVFYNNAAAPDTLEIVDVEGGIPRNVQFEGNRFIYIGNTSGIFSKPPQRYKGMIFRDNEFTGNVKRKEEQ